jgi:hypothetical protein
MKASTGWKEEIGADEAERFAGYAQRFAAIQNAKSKRYGVGRALHRKQISAASGNLEVLAGIPAYARHGLFARAANHPVQVRLSNGGMDRAPDRAPDIRGFSLRVLGVHGDSALGIGPAQSQDFTLINQEVFSHATSAGFVDFVEAASRGIAPLLRHLLRVHGPFRVAGQVGRMFAALAKPFSGFATEPFYSGLPMACGAYAVRIRLLPAAGNGKARSRARENWHADFQARLQQHDLEWELQLQPFVSEELTPIEDASVNWASPYVTVARLSLPKQDMQGPEGKALAEAAEAGTFDPWHALAEHRPLGEVQRARKVVYFQSQKGRGAA